MVRTMVFTLLLLMTYGTITGIQGNILEKHISLSKAKDAISAVNSPQKIWYEQFLADFSDKCLCWW